MELAQAINTIEYKIATEADSFEAGRTIRMDINSSWPDESTLSEALRRKYPYLRLCYDRQANDRVQLVLDNGGR